MSKRQKMTQLKYVTETFDVLLDKTVGSEKIEQGNFLISQLRRLFPTTGWLVVTINVKKL